MLTAGDPPVPATVTVLVSVLSICPFHKLGGPISQFRCDGHSQGFLLVVEQACEKAVLLNKPIRVMSNILFIIRSKVVVVIPPVLIVGQFREIKRYTQILFYPINTCLFVLVLTRILR